MDEMVQEYVRELKACFGEPLEVGANKRREIRVRFEQGNTVILRSPFTFGYQGTGPRCFFRFLRNTGFPVTLGEVQRMKAPLVLTRKAEHIRTRKKPRKKGVRCRSSVMKGYSYRPML